MLQVVLVGNLGANAEKKVSNGQEFTTFRVAHNNDWTDQSGERHKDVVWCDCILHGHPAVVDYLNAGTMVCVTGNPTLRVYSSKKDRCMKAGMTINVQRIELLGGKTDPIPAQLINTDGVIFPVSKYYHVDAKDVELIDNRWGQYAVDANGWVTKKEVKAENETGQEQTSNTETTNANQ